MYERDESLLDIFYAYCCNQPRVALWCYFGYGGICFFLKYVHFVNRLILCLEV